MTGHQFFKCSDVTLSRLADQRVVILGEIIFQRRDHGATSRASSPEFRLETGFAHHGVIQPFLAVKVLTKSGQIDAGVAANVPNVCAAQPTL